MNFLRRIYLLLVSLLLVIVVTTLLLSPQTAIEWVGRVSELAPALRTILAVVAGILLLALMFIQIRPDRKPETSGLMMRGSGALTEVSVESARDRILKAVNDVPDVVSVEADVKPVRGKADIELQVEVLGHDVKLPVKQKEINRALQQVIDKQLGLRMAGQPRIHLRYHKEAPVQPPATVYEPPPVAVIPPVEPKPAFVEPSPPPPVISPKPALEPEPEAKSTGGLFGWLGSKDEEVEDTTIRLPEKPVITAASPSTMISTSSVLDEFTDDNLDEFDPLPPSSSLVSDVQSLEVTPDPLVITKVELDDKPLNLDLDEELAKTSTDDFDENTSDEDEEKPADDNKRTSDDSLYSPFA